MRKYPFAIVSLALAVFLYSCPAEDSSFDSMGGGGNSPTLIIKETPKRATTDVRDSYGIFTLSTEGGELTGYHLAVKEATATPPTATEMSAGALKRNISTTEIHVLIAQRLNAPMVTFAKRYFADQTKQQLGTGMRGTFSANPYAGFAYDNTATAANAWVAESVLKPSTDYKLYGMPSGGAVAELLSFSTDATPANGTHSTAGVNQVYFPDTTLEKDYLTLSLNADEYYIFPLQSDYYDASTITVLQIYFSLQTGNSLTIFPSVIVPSIPSGYDNTLYLVANAGSDIFNQLKKGYVLINTQSLSASSIYFGISWSVTGFTDPPPYKHYSTLTIQ